MIDSCGTVHSITKSKNYVAGRRTHDSRMAEQPHLYVPTDLSGWTMCLICEIIIALRSSVQDAPSVGCGSQNPKYMTQCVAANKLYPQKLILDTVLSMLLGCLSHSTHVRRHSKRIRWNVLKQVNTNQNHNSIERLCIIL